MKTMKENFELLPHCSHMRQFMVFFTCITAKPAKKREIKNRLIVFVGSNGL